MVITTTNAGNLQQISDFSPDVKQISFSPNADLVAIATQVGDADYEVVILDVLTGQPVGFINGRMDFFEDLVWSPDQQRIAVISERVTGGGTEEYNVKVYTLAQAANPAWYIMGNSDLWITDYIEPDLTQPSELPRHRVHLTWNPDSTMIAIAFFDRLSVYDIVGESELVSISIPALELVAWASNGEYIVTQSKTSGVRLWGIL
jgi:WD40 repeat protein